MARLTRTEARDILAQAGVPANVDFHSLRSAQVEALIALADKWRYRHPRNANGSRARYFCAYVQRTANRPR